MTAGHHPGLRRILVLRFPRDPHAQMVWTMTGLNLLMACVAALAVHFCATVIVQSWSSESLVDGLLAASAWRSLIQFSILTVALLLLGLGFLRLTLERPMGPTLQAALWWGAFLTYAYLLVRGIIILNSSNAAHVQLAQATMIAVALLGAGIPAITLLRRKPASTPS